MLDIERTIENLKGIEVTDDFENDMICAFDTTEEEIIVSRQHSRYEDYQLYENKADAPIICVKIKDGKIINAWKA